MNLDLQYFNVLITERWIENCKDDILSHLLITFYAGVLVAYSQNAYRIVGIMFPWLCFVSR
jgi:hypothetical protein